MLGIPVSVRKLQFKELPLYGVTEVIKSFWNGEVEDGLQCVF